jgi:hypothetical protein
MKNVKTGVLTVAFLAGGIFAFSPSVHAASKLAKACKKDMKKFGCTAKSDADLHECLEQHEDHAKKNDGFSHACYEAHEAYEKASGKMESEEAEHHEGQ